MKNTREVIIDHIEKYKEQNEFEIEISNEELEELEKVRTEFCNEIGQIIGSCKMEIENNVLGFKLLKIVKTKTCSYDGKEKFKLLEIQNKATCTESECTKVEGNQCCKFCEKLYECIREGCTCSEIDKNIKDCQYAKF